MICPKYMSTSNNHHLQLLFIGHLASDRIRILINYLPTHLRSLQTYHLTTGVVCYPTPPKILYRVFSIGHHRLGKIDSLSITTWNNVLLWEYSEQVEETYSPELIYILTIVLQSIFYEFGDDGAEKRARQLQAWVCVDFNQPHVQIYIDHKVQSKNLEIVAEFFRVDSPRASSYRICGNSLHLRIYMLVELLPLLTMIFLNVVSKIIIADFIAFLVFPIIGKIFLHCIISQVYSSIVIHKCIFAGSSSNIAIFIPISLNISVYRSYHDVVTKIKLPLIVEERSLDIGLDYVGPIRAICILLSLLQHFFDILQRKTHFDAVTSIAILTGLYYPRIVLHSFCFIFIVFCNFFGSLMIIPQKLKIFFVLQSILNMKRQGEKIKDIQIHFFVVVTHGIEQSFFIANHIVVYQMIMHFSLFYFINFYILFVFKKFCS